MISTPHTAYCWLVEAGVEYETAKRLIAMGRGAFEYFLEVIDSPLRAIHVSDQPPS